MKVETVNRPLADQHDVLICDLLGSLAPIQGTAYWAANYRRSPLRWVIEGAGSDEVPCLARARKMPEATHHRPDYWEPS